MRFLILDANKEEAERTSVLIKKACPESEVVTADNTREACYKVEHERIDSVIVEILIPKENGYRAITSMKELSPKTHYAIYTRSKYGIDSYIGLHVGADDIFVKSTNPDNGREFLEYIKKIQHESTNV